MECLKNQDFYMKYFKSVSEIIYLQGSKDAIFIAWGDLKVNILKSGANILASIR